MRPKLFQDFSEVEADIAKNAPPVVFKYRSWKDDFHKDVLTNQDVWFSHPFDLNDPLDVRPETVFNEMEFFDSRYFQKMLKGADKQFPTLTKHQQFVETMHQWNAIKANPKMISENMHQWNSERENFDRVGVFSTCANGTNTRMWEEYGNQGKGYCIGFNTVEFCRQMKSGYGLVEYTDTPYLHLFLSDDSTDYDEMHEIDPLYTKKTIWSHEEEFRFITAGIGLVSTRLQKFDFTTVVEIILGNDISVDDEEQILKIISDKYPDSLPVFKIKKGASNSLTKIQIK